MTAIVDPTSGEVLGTGQDADLDAIEDVHELRRLASAFRQQAHGLGRDVENLERDARNHLRKIATLEAELKRQRQEAPEAQLVQAIFRGWVQATGRNRKVTKLGPAREKAVLARIRENHDAQRMIRAATIGARGATTSNRDAERLALLRVMREAVGMVEPAQADALRAMYRETLGKGTKVYDDLELIFRNEVNLERFADLADQLDPVGASRPTLLPEGE